MIQYSTTHRNNNVADITTQLSTTAYLLFYSGSVPANCAASATGTLLASLPCSNPFGAAPSAGVLTASAITAASPAASNAGPYYWRLCTSSAGTTVIAQGNAYITSTLLTSASTTSGNLLAFTTGGAAIAVGQTVSGTNIPAGTYVLAATATQITMNQNVTGTVASGATITFGGDISLGAAIATGVNVSVSSLTITANGP